ncbi:hypothetical protein [Rhodococcus qingshengii]|uniref:hypothetical protein n=1 Tax=Rhodococcus qingshengii TaxID=334542 RepID=UPI0001A21AD7|nr:hypothetical protein [Rhodococcus qingshengii]EEN85915.1 hypothetical protein RHOER0001_4827 [Rhodococcus erythropolis SK121]
MAERRYLEVPVGTNIVMVLDHRTVEVFDRTAASTSEVARWHVEHIAVKAKPSKSGLKLTIGNRLADDSIAVAGPRASLTVPPENEAAVIAFFDEVKAARV